jgi:hypothetical protein
VFEAGAQQVADLPLVFDTSALADTAITHLPPSGSDCAAHQGRTTRIATIGSNAISKLKLSPQR